MNYRTVKAAPSRPLLGVKQPWKHPTRAARALRLRWLRKHNPEKFSAVVEARVTRDLYRLETALKAIP